MTIRERRKSPAAGALYGIALTVGLWLLAAELVLPASWALPTAGIALVLCIVMALAGLRGERAARMAQQGH